MPEPDPTIGVLIVDDHAVARRGLLAFLDGEDDLEVLGAADGGAQALELLDRLSSDGRRPAVVVMDLQMSPVDGIQATREIRARYTDVEVVALTSFGDQERVHAALEAGASGYLLKDADADELVAAIRAAHRGELQLDPAIARRLMASLQAGARPARAADRAGAGGALLVGEGQANKEIAAELLSASGPRAPTSRTSSASSGSARERRPRSGRCARGWWMWMAGGGSAPGPPLTLGRPAAPLRGSRPRTPLARPAADPCGARAPGPRGARTAPQGVVLAYRDMGARALVPG